MQTQPIQPYLNKRALFQLNTLVSIIHKDAFLATMENDERLLKQIVYVSSLEHDIVNLST